ncbi:MAG: hypothetical protein K0B02_03565 [DPANN group archaeon]|nr:hypothetical protein [DPANN group archaeon]
MSNSSNSTDNNKVSEVSVSNLHSKLKNAISKMNSLEAKQNKVKNINISTTTDKVDINKILSNVDNKLIAHDKLWFDKIENVKKTIASLTDNIQSFEKSKSNELDKKLIELRSDLNNKDNLEFLKTDMYDKFNGILNAIKTIQSTLKIWDSVLDEKVKDSKQDATIISDINNLKINSKDVETRFNALQKNLLELSKMMKNHFEHFDAISNNTKNVDQKINVINNNITSTETQLKSEISSFKNDINLKFNDIQKNMLGELTELKTKFEVMGKFNQDTELFLKTKVQEISNESFSIREAELIKTIDIIKNEFENSQNTLAKNTEEIIKTEIDDIIHNFSAVNDGLSKKVDAIQIKNESDNAAIKQKILPVLSKYNDILKDIVSKISSIESITNNISDDDLKVMIEDVLKKQDFYEISFDSKIEDLKKTNELVLNSVTDDIEKLSRVSEMLNNKIETVLSNSKNMVAASNKNMFVKIAQISSSYNKTILNLEDDIENMKDALSIFDSEIVKTEDIDDLKKALRNVEQDSLRRSELEGLKDALNIMEHKSAKKVEVENLKNDMVLLLKNISKLKNTEIEIENSELDTINIIKGIKSEMINMKRSNEFLKKELEELKEEYGQLKYIRETSPIIIE